VETPDGISRPYCGYREAVIGSRRSSITTCEIRSSRLTTSARSSSTQLARKHQVKWQPRHDSGCAGHGIEYAHNIVATRLGERRADPATVSTEHRQGETRTGKVLFPNQASPLSVDQLRPGSDDPRAVPVRAPNPVSSKKPIQDLFGGPARGRNAAGLAHLRGQS
jgi:hypothetical protein